MVLKHKDQKKLAISVLKKIKNEDSNHIHKLKINTSISAQQPQLSYMARTANSKF